jgi:hypothetical protein
MEKAYNISNIKFENDVMVLTIDNQLIKLKLSDISNKLANASDKQKSDYRISPSGYGIHWEQLDEDLSINGLLNTFKSPA